MSLTLWLEAHAAAELDEPRVVLQPKTDELLRTEGEGNPKARIAFFESAVVIRYRFVLLFESFENLPDHAAGYVIALPSGLELIENRLGFGRPRGAR